MGGACWISPRNCESASSTFSRVTWLHGAVLTRAPSLSYVSVSHPSKHVVRYSYQHISLREEASMYSTHLCAIQEIVQFLGAFADTDNSKPLTLNIQHHANPSAYTHREHRPRADPACHLVQPSRYPSAPPSFYPPSSQVSPSRRRDESYRRASSIGPRRA